MSSMSVEVKQAANQGEFAPKQGTLVSNNDTVAVAVSGQQWATVRVDFDGSGNPTVQQEYSIDGGVNWLAAPYAKRLDLVSANPSVTANIAGASSKQTWEVPLPGNCTNFRVRQTAGTTAANVIISGGALYTPGVPVVGVLYDLTSGTNTAINTGTLDLSGWTTVQHDFVPSGGALSAAIFEADDAGTQLGNIASFTAGTTTSGGLGPGVTVGGTAGAVAATASIPLPKRAVYNSNAIAAQTSRIRLVARR